MPTTEHRLEGLLEVAGLLSAQLEPARLLPSITRLAARVAEAETASLLLVDPASGELYFDVALGLPPELQKTRLKPGQGIAGWVAAEGRPLVVADVRADPRWDSGMDRRTGFTTRSILAVPMKSAGRVLGVIEVINKRRGRFGEPDRGVLEAFAAQAAIALENARLFATVSGEKRKFETVLAEMGEGALLADAKGSTRLANASAASLLGLSAVEGLGVGTGALETAFAGFRVEPPLERLLAGDSEQRFEAVREAPKPLVLAGTVRPLSDGALWVFRDVTAERHEEALKQEFFSLISHKLRTPLVSVLGFCDVLLKDPALGEQQRQAVRVISDRGRSLAALVDKLLKFTWLHGAHAAGLRKESVAVERLLRHASRQFEPEIDDGRLRLEKGEGLDLRVLAEPKLAADALAYLIENAYRFNPKQVRRVQVSARAAEAAVEVSVADDGPGIPPEERRRVFKKFYQVEAKFTGQVEGWGLGLPFVDQAMKAHGGSVRLDSRLGQGTTVTLVFPTR